MRESADAVAWLAKRTPAASEESAMRLLGLVWGRAPRDVIVAAASRTRIRATPRRRVGAVTGVSVGCLRHWTGAGCVARERPFSACIARLHQGSKVFTRNAGAGWLVACQRQVATRPASL